MKHKVSILLLVCLLVISLTGCGGGIVPSASDKGTIKGQVMIPVETKDISGWIPVANATVTFIDYEGVIHTVITDEDGYYIFEDFASGSLYCITATAQLDGKTIVFKDLIKDVIAGEDYDLGTADADSTALTLIVEELTDKGLTPEEIDLEEIQDSDSFGQLQGDISEVIENHENVLDNSDIINEVYSIADEYISPTPVNHAPTITSTQITTAIVNILYAYTVEATDPDGDTITYSLNIKPNEMNISSLTGGITWIPATSGNYNVTVNASDGDLSDTQSFTITVTETPNQSPTASFTADLTSGVASLEVSFNASSSSDSDGSIISYAWDFKDGSTGNGQSINHTFSSIGSYNVELTVTDDKGATDSLTKTITVTDSIVSNQSPTASFTANPTSGVAPLEVSFNASSSSDSDGSITSYDWDFKDGETGNGEIISHTFSSIGSYNVELTVTDDKGATDSTTKEIEVISGTQAGGIISENTTWTKQDSPYLVTDTVQIPSGVILTISPGVTVSKPSSGDIFLINGEIYAHGTPAEKIIFEGGNNSNFFNPDNSDINTFLDLEYCTITNGNSFWPPSGHEQYGAFSLKHCILENLSDYSYIWYPKQDVYIEYNQFINTGGFSVGQDDNIKVYIRYNLFDRKNPNLPSYADFCVKNWAAYSSSQTVVQNNSFINMNGIVLELPGGYGDAAMSAAENYWGTQEIIAIENMIYDKNDDITCAGYIQYEPILTEPHPDVP